MLPEVNWTVEVNRDCQAKIDSGVDKIAARRMQAYLAYIRNCPPPWDHSRALDLALL